MEKNLFREVYKQVCGLALKDCPPSSLSGLLHGYLSVYSMVRVYPWLEDEYGSLWDIHDQIREIARVLQELLKDKDIPVDTRAGYAVDLMDAYLLYSDMKFLDVALDAAYEILIPKGSDKIVLPCHTPNVCRLLCNCYYFTGEEEYGLLVGNLVTEILGLSRITSLEELVDWWNAIGLYESVVGEMDLPVEEQRRMTEERVRWAVRVQQWEDGITKCVFGTSSDISQSLVDLFYVLAKRKFTEYNSLYGK
jgi:hypothetical protein